VPPKGYRHVSLREELYSMLVEYAKSQGLSSAAEAIAHLLAETQRCRELEHTLAEIGKRLDRLEERLQAMEKRLEELETLSRKTYLALLRLLEEPTGRTTEEGPESPAGEAEGMAK